MLRVAILPVSTILLLDLGIVATVWYLFIFHFNNRANVVQLLFECRKVKFIDIRTIIARHSSMTFFIGYINNAAV